MTAWDVGIDDGGVRIGRVTLWRPVRESGPRITRPELSRLVCGSEETSASCFPELEAPGTGFEPATPSWARAGGTLLRGRHPLVIAVGSADSRGGEFVALAEALASHGLVVAELIPPPDSEADGYDAEGVRRSVRRIDQALSLLGREADVDVTRVGFIGWSFGGVPATVAACRRAGALVSLDSALRYRYGVELLKEERFDADICSAALLSIATAVPSSVPTDETFVNAWPSGRVERRVSDLRHAEFSDRHAGLRSRRPEEEAAAFRCRFGVVAADVVKFVTDRLRAAAGPATRATTDLMRTRGDAAVAPAVERIRTILTVEPARVLVPCDGRALARAMGARSNGGTSMSRGRRLMPAGALLVLLAARAALAAPAPPAAQAAAAPGCTTAAHRQFDFWIGEWEVEANGKRAGTNRVEPVLGACAITERWEGAGGGSGTSLNAYFAGDARWHQTWIDSQGGRLELAGSWDEATRTMTLSGAAPDRDGRTVLNEIAWERRDDGTVRQRWRTSADQGQTWQVVFDGLYRRRR